MGIWFLLIGIMVISMLVSSQLRSRLERYAQMALKSGLTGKEIAEKMLRENGIYDVKVISVEGRLTDHYNPANKTVNLSPEIFHGQSIAAAAVAAHECGHAVQHARAYSWLSLRSKLVPAVQIGGSIVPWVLIAGILTLKTFPALLLGGIILFAITTLFAFITLPVEFDASRRALAWLEQTNVTTPDEQPKAKDGLKWAAMTYVIAAISSLATLLYYVSIYNNRR
ncbi:MAG TPA: zinc metallopeptidase [Chitinophagaceae bacterium]